MIIQNLNKTFKNGKTKVVALKDINLSFSKKGLVFVTGKSGSGKSTLLNLIGGLLDITNGDIFVQGRSIKGMKDDEIENYRLNYVSFIFQDFCLINELNVYENIALSMKLLNKNDENVVDEALQKFDIFDLKEKYPNQLSAGQKQRVAIARVLVKESPIILCDEPTGNLDSINSRQILSTLKEVSKDHLVIVVSHNLEDAYFYGDRVIELKDGQVVSDLIKDENVKVDDNCIVVHDFNSLSREELDNLNEKLKNGQIEKIISPKYIFKMNNEKYGDGIKFQSSKTRLSFKNSISLAKRFLRKKSLGMIACSLISSILFGLLYVAQSFISFNTKNTLSEIYDVSLSDTFILEKGHFDQSDKINKTAMTEVKSDELHYIDENYQGEYYQLYNYSLPCSLTSWNLQNGIKINLNSNFENFFIKETYGVLVTNEDYIKTLFSFSDDIQFSAKLENEKDYGIYITDYIADSIIYFRNNIDSYNDLLGQYKNNRDSTYAYINGIINTNYKIKYQALILEFVEAYSNNDEAKIEKLMKSEEYFNICEEVLVKLGVCFSTNKNFIQAVNNPSARNFAIINNSKLKFNLLETQYYFGNAWALNGKNFGINLNDFDLSLSLNLFNSIIGQKLSFEEAEEYANVLNTKEPLFILNDLFANSNETKSQQPVTIKIHNTIFSDCDILMGDELFFFAKSQNFIPYSIYFDNYKSAINLIDHMFEVGYFFPSFYSSAIIEIGHLVSIFNNFFILILSILYFGSLTALLIFTYSHIKKNNYNIGVLKSLGASTKDLIKIFTPHIIVMGILCFAFFGVFAFSFSYVGNGLITTSLIANFKYPALKNIQILNFAPSWFVFDLVAVFTVIALSILIPILFLKKIKPIEILHKD